MGDKVKLAEAEALLKKAKEHTTKTVFRWSCDYDTGASEFEKAALIYRNLKKIDEANKAFTAASESFVKAKNPFMGAKCLENAATMMKDAGNNDAAVPHFINASQLYAQDNKPQQQADTLKKAALIVGPAKAGEAAALIRDAISTLEDSEKWHAVGDLYRAVSIILVKNEKYVEAIDMRKRQLKSLQQMENSNQASKNCLEVVILCLVLGDVVLADREFKELSENGYGFAHSRDQAVGYELVAAIQDRDGDRLQEAQKDQMISFLLPDVARLVKKIKVSGGGPKVTQTVGGDSANAGGGLVGTSAAKDDDAGSEDSDDIR